MHISASQKNSVIFTYKIIYCFWWHSVVQMIVMEVASASFVSLILIKYSIYYFVYPKYNIASFE